MRILFDEPFSHVPAIITSLAGVDSANDRNLRVTTLPHSITKFGFDLEVRTWSDSSINFVSVNWMAAAFI